MEPNMPSSPSDNGGAKAAFRKPSNETVNRKYRRRSPSNGSSSSDGTPNCARSSSPIPSREYPAKSSDDRRKKDDRRDLDREYGRSQYGRRGDSYRNSDRHYYRSSHNYRRQDDYKSDKLVDEDERKYSKLSARSGRDSRVGAHSAHTSRESQQHGSRDHLHNADKSSRGTTDGSGHRSGDRDDSALRRASSGHRLKETSRSNNIELDCQKYPKEEQKKYDDQESGRHNSHKERSARELTERSEDRTTFTSEDQESPAKKPKLFGLYRGKDHGTNVSKVTTTADERHPSNSQQAQKFVNKVTSDLDFVTDSDIDAAKVAAMKAAELVNRNLIGAGCMSADQKKKLLWGNKKNTTAVEESTHRWDTSLFSDRERQEKFNKLMGVKGEARVEDKPDNQDGSSVVEVEKQNQLQLDLEKQYTAGLRRRDGRTVGLGL